MRHADVAVVVANPEVSSIRDADRIIGLLDAATEEARRGEHVEKHLLDPLRSVSGATRRDLEGGGRA